MKVKYHMDDRLLIFNLNKQYGIQVESIDFIPMGDSAYSYRVNCNNGDRYYLKLFDHQNDRQRRSIERLHSYLPLTWQMNHQKLFRNVTYPIKNKNGDFKTTFNKLTIVLFNFIEGETLADAYPFSKELLEKIAQLMATLHQMTDSIDTSLISRETFDISFETDLEKCLSLFEVTHSSENDTIQILREQVLLRKEKIYHLLNLVRNLREVVLNENIDKVLCHGDLWGGNIISHSNELYLIDWESSMIAPREYDLFSYINRDFDVFYSSYKKHIGQDLNINLDLLRFYSYRHHLRNLTNWLMNILY